MLVELGSGRGAYGLMDTVAGGCVRRKVSQRDFSVGFYVGVFICVWDDGG